jgi:drug/metabolite transporter (DMT)-like permease
MALLSERHSGWIWAAIALLFIGLTLIHRSGRKAVTRHHAAP